MSMEFAYGVVAGFIVALVVFSIALRLSSRRARRAATPTPVQITKTVAEATDTIDQMRRLYAIEITDWGPGYDGEGTLPRYRWQVWRADKKSSTPIEGEIVPGLTHPYMLGNAFSDEQARSEAELWIRAEIYKRVSD